MDTRYSLIAENIEKTLDSYGITVRVAEINTNKDKSVQFCLEIKSGTLISDIEKYQREIALAVASPTGKVTIEAPIPGRSMVGITIPEIVEKYLPQRESKYAHYHPLAKLVLIPAQLFQILGYVFELAAEVINTLGVRAVQLLTFIIGGVVVTYLSTNGFNPFEIIINTIVMFFVLVFVIGLHEKDERKKKAKMPEDVNKQT